MEGNFAVESFEPVNMQSFLTLHRHTHMESVSVMFFSLFTGMRAAVDPGVSWTPCVLTMHKCMCVCVRDSLGVKAYICTCALHVQTLNCNVHIQVIFSLQITNAFPSFINAAVLFFVKFVKVKIKELLCVCGCACVHVSVCFKTPRQCVLPAHFLFRSEAFLQLWWVPVLIDHWPWPRTVHTGCCHDILSLYMHATSWTLSSNAKE